MLSAPCFWSCAATSERGPEDEIYERSPDATKMSGSDSVNSRGGPGSAAFGLDHYGDALASMSNGIAAGVSCFAENAGHMYTTTSTSMTIPNSHHIGTTLAGRHTKYVAITSRRAN